MNIQDQIRYFCFSYFIFFPVFLSAQEDCPVCPTGQIDGFVISPASKVACDSVTVCVKNCIPGAVNISYDYRNDGTRINDTIFTYTQPGVYVITQFAQVNAGGATQLITSKDTITVFPTPKPEFRIDRLCAGNKIFLDISDTVYQQYLINWGDNSPLEIVAPGTSSLSHQYSINRSYAISVIGNYVPGGCGDTAVILVNTLETLVLPTVKRIQTDIRNPISGQVSLSLETDTNFQYQFFKDNSAVLLAEAEGNGSTLVQHLTPLNTEMINCFRIRVLDFCGELLDSEAIYCSLSLETQAEDSQNRIRWTPYPNLNATIQNGFQHYLLYRNNQPYQIIPNLNTAEFIDQDVDCSVEYCYRIEAIFNSLSLDFVSASNSACTTTFSSAIPPAVNQLNASVETFRSIRLFWNLAENVEVDTYTISSPNESLEILTDNNQVLIEDLRITAPLCYQVSYRDECGNLSASTARTCPVFLSGSSSGNGLVELNWTDYENSAGIYERYVVEKLDEAGNVYEEFPVGFQVRFRDPGAKNDRQILRYRIRTVIDDSAGLFSYSNVVEITQKFKIFFPNAFSPNGDNLNESFKPTYLFVKNYEMRIYNRAGELLFVSNDIEQGWDGNYKGKEAQQGAYIYMVYLEDFTGEKFNTQGTFTLIR